VYYRARKNDERSLLLNVSSVVCTIERGKFVRRARSIDGRGKHSANIRDNPPGTERRKRIRADDRTGRIAYDVTRLGGRVGKKNVGKTNTRRGRCCGCPQCPDGRPQAYQRVCALMREAGKCEGALVSQGTREVGRAHESKEAGKQHKLPTKYQTHSLREQWFTPSHGAEREPKFRFE
jgi:hypothetical protein